MSANTARPDVIDLFFADPNDVDSPIIICNVAATKKVVDVSIPVDDACLRQT